MTPIYEDDESPGCLLGGSLQLLVLVVLVIAGRRRT
jgi:hypothetical protein